MTSGTAARGVARRCWRHLHDVVAEMAKKILLGMAVVAGVCVIAAAGFRFGKHLRQGERVQVVQVERTPAAESDA